MYTINGFAISKLNNAEITAFYINLQKAINNSEAANLGLSAVTPLYDAALTKLINQVYSTTGSEYTAAMKAADSKRDQIYKRIRLRLQMVDVAEENEALNACKDAVKAHLLSQYGAIIPQLPYQEESAIIKGFLVDLRSKIDTDAITALGIGSDIAALESANNEFIELYASRAAEKAEGDTGLTLKIRAEMYQYYQQICFTTQYIANSTEETLVEKAPVCQDFIGVLNVLLDDAKRRYNQRMAGIVENTDDGGSGEESDGGEGSEGSESGSEGGSSAESGAASTESGGASSGASSSGTSSSGTESGSSTDSGASSDSGSGSSSTDSGSSSSDSGSSSDTNAPSETGVDDGREISY